VLVEAQYPGLGGVVPTFSPAAAEGNRVPPNVRLTVVNGGGSSVTLTIATPGTARGGLSIADRAVTVGTGVFPVNAKAVDVPASMYMQADGYCHLSWSETTDVLFAVLGQVTT
jgi:hypothetical protein